MSAPRRFLVLLLVLATSGCMGWAPGRKAYWDERVNELCAKDGGLEIFERLHISSADLAYLRKFPDGSISITIKELAHPSAPVYAINERARIRDHDPSVWRSVWQFVRRADEKVVARWVAYSRVGGGFPGPSHETAFTCPGLDQMTSQVQRIFILGEASK